MTGWLQVIRAVNIKTPLPPAEKLPGLQLGQGSKKEKSSGRVGLQKVLIVVSYTVAPSLFKGIAPKF